MIRWKMDRQNWSVESEGLEGECEERLDGRWTGKTGQYTVQAKGQKGECEERLDGRWTLDRQNRSVYKRKVRKENVKNDQMAGTDR